LYCILTRSATANSTRSSAVAEKPRDADVFYKCSYARKVTVRLASITRVPCFFAHVTFNFPRLRLAATYDETFRLCRFLLAASSINARDDTVLWILNQEMSEWPLKPLKIINV